MSNRYTDDKAPVNIDINNAGFDYTGSIRPDGAWTIMKSTTSTGAVITYTMGASDYSTNWTNRTSLTYSLPLYN